MEEYIVSAGCRFCSHPLEHMFVDLGMSPLSNRFLTEEQLNKAETFYPLKTRVCEKCLLVQLEEYESPAEIFQDYVYFSSYSDSWLQHCAEYVDSIIPRAGLGTGSLVVELASNDGYLLQYFVKQNIPVLGIEPAANVAEVARGRGIDTIAEFFGVALAGRLAAEGKMADLLVANNVLAHVPDLNDFVAGIKLVLNSGGVATLEFPHLLQLIRHVQFDTIYHEHFSYFSLGTVRKIFQSHGLRVFDVEQLATHGGSLRIHVCHSDNDSMPDTSALDVVIREEAEDGLDTLRPYLAFSGKVERCKRDLLSFLIGCREEGRTVAAYGAPAKGNTLLNYCGVREDLLAYTVDRSPHKQGKFLPGVHIPVSEPERIFREQPDYVLILPWNLQDEVVAQMSRISDWGGKFVIPVPETRVLS